MSAKNGLNGFHCSDKFEKYVDESNDKRRNIVHTPWAVREYLKSF